VRIRLTESQLGYAESVAKGRRQNPHTKTRKFAKNRSDWDIDFLGAKAEVAISMPLGCEINEDSKPKSSSNYDMGIDFSLNGLSIQVKATEHKNGRLIFKDSYEFNADIYILAYVNADIIEVRGWISREKLMTARGMHVEGPLKNTWVTENKHLSSVFSLISAIK